jgi:GT2 family glycosyltransferase
VTKVSFIVSAYNRPDHLRICLSALILQTMPHWEAIVMDNADDAVVLRDQQWLCGMDPRIRHFGTKQNGFRFPGCYHSSEYGALFLAQGDWVGFPSDDSYYVPHYTEKLLTAAERRDLELIYCDLVTAYPHFAAVLPVKAQCGSIDKTNFLLKRSRFFPFPGKRDEGGACCADGILIDALIKNRIRHGKVQEVLCVHN